MANLENQEKNPLAGLVVGPQGPVYSDCKWVMQASLAGVQEVAIGHLLDNILVFDR